MMNNLLIEPVARRIRLVFGSTKAIPRIILMAGVAAASCPFSSPTVVAQETASRWGVRALAEAQLEAAIRSLENATSDDAAWIAFQSTVQSPVQTDTSLLSAVSLMAEAAQKTSRFQAINRRFAAVHVGGYGGAWSMPAGRLRFIRFALLHSAAEQTILDLDANERLLAADSLTEVFESARYPSTQRACERLLAWKGWTPLERRTFAHQYLIATNFAGSTAAVLGRTDDGLENEMLQFAQLQWASRRAVPVNVLERLIARKDTRSLNLATQIRDELGLPLPCSGGECGSFAARVELLMFRARLITADKHLCFAAIEDEAGSSDIDFSASDERRILACRKLIELGVSKSEIRESFLRFTEKLNSALPPNSPWSRRPQNLGLLKSYLVALGVFDPGKDLPGVMWIPPLIADGCADGH